MSDHRDGATESHIDKRHVDSDAPLPTAPAWRAPRPTSAPPRFSLSATGIGSVMAESEVLRPPTILLVESDPLIAGTTLALMHHLGYLTLPPASTVAEARERLRTPPDAVLLEISLRHGESSLPFADELMARGLPFAFFSAYHIHDLPARFAACRIVMKPVGDAMLTAELLALAGWSGVTPGEQGIIADGRRLLAGTVADRKVSPQGGSSANDP